MLQRFVKLPFFASVCGGLAYPQEVLIDYHDNQGPVARIFSISPPRDMNGDGIGDFLLGSPNTETHVLVSGADLSPLSIYASPPSGMGGFFYADSHGLTLAWTGDLNGDAVSDFVVGASSYSVQWQSQGMVRVFDGSTYELIAEHPGTEIVQGYGRRLATLGDLDGDGVGEYAMLTNAQDLYLFEGLSSEPTRILVGDYGPPTPTRDFDGDGVRDFITPFHTAEPSEFGMQLISTRTGAILAKGISEPYGGYSVAVVDDMDGDGLEDMAFGVPGVGNVFGGFGTGGPLSSPGGVFFYSSADGRTLHYLDGGPYLGNETLFGWSISGGKDVNGDGVRDLLVGAPWAGRYPPPYEDFITGRGAALLFSGATGALLWKVDGHQIGERLGYEVKLIDDFNGDGLADWMVLSPQYDVDDPVGDPTDSFTDGRIQIFAGAVGDAASVCDGSIGAGGARLFSAGAISLRQNAFSVSVERGIPGGLGLLITGAPAPAMPFWGGELCVGLAWSQVRFVTLDDQGTALEEIDLYNDPFVQQPQSPEALQPGDVRAFQLLYFDRTPGSRRLSNALEVKFLP